MSNIYGVDTEKEVLPWQVREAIINCFCLAHADQAEMGGDEEAVKVYCQQIVRKAFKETGGDFDEPNKASLQTVVNWLADFSKNLRDQTVISTHLKEIEKLINLIED